MDVAITAKSPTPKILKNAAMENGVKGDVLKAENNAPLGSFNKFCCQKVKEAKYPFPEKIFLAISANLAESEKTRNFL